MADDRMRNANRAMDNESEESKHGKHDRNLSDQQKQAGGMQTGTRPGGFEREDREREQPGSKQTWNKEENE